jgi:hypothetical protein
VTEILDASEQADLAQLEAVVERGMNTFFDVGNALAAISQRKLYRSEYASFDEYCRTRWNMGRAHAYRMIAAAETVSPIGDKGLPLPTNEGQARELARVPEPQRAEVWGKTLARTDGMPTAAAVRETFESTQPAPEENIWDESGADEVVDAELVDEPARPEPPKPKRRPLPEALAEATHDFVRVAERLARIHKDDRFDRNRHQTHHRASEFVQALVSAAELAADMDLPAADTTEEARRWWATSLHKTSDALRDVANSLEQEQ